MSIGTRHAVILLSINFSTNVRQGEVRYGKVMKGNYFYLINGASSNVKARLALQSYNLGKISVDFWKKNKYENI